MANPGDFAYTVKQQADIVRVVGEYVKLRKAGAQNFSGLCPFHNEKTPSFSVHATRQFFHCFGCGASGDVFSFVQKLENITFPEAVRAVAQKFGIPLPKTTFSSPAEAQEARLRTVLMEVHERACDFFREQLRRPEGARAREYLAGRGLNDEMIARFRIGFAPDSGFILRDLLKAKYDEETLRASGLFAWKQDDSGPPPTPVALTEPSPPSTPAKKNDAAEAAADTRADEKTAEKTSDTRPDRGKAAIYSRFRNRVMFPITSETGKVIAFTGRTLATDEKSGPKYLNSPETPIYSKSRVLFNLDLAKEAMRKLDYAILVEGQMDCISVYAAGFHNVMASSGTAFTELQARLLGRFTKNVVVNFDPDTAGAKATERTLGLLVEEEFQIKVLTLEPGFDPDLYIRRKGKDAYAQALKNSQRYFEYLIERARAQFGGRSAESKVKAVNYLLPHIQRVPSRIVRDELAQEIAHKLQIDSAILRQELRHTASNRATKVVKMPAEAQITDAERILIRALASAPEMLHGRHVSAREGADEEFDPARQAQFALHHEPLHEGLASESLLLALLEGVSQGTHAMDLPLSESDRRTLAAILIREEEELTPELLEGAVKALRRMTVRRRLETVQRDLQDAVRRNDPSRLAELSAEKVRLKRLLGDPAVVENAGAA
jgi:DNA primase